MKIKPNCQIVFLKLENVTQGNCECNTDGYAMGDCLRAGKPSRCEACQLGRLSLLPSVGR